MLQYPTCSIPWNNELGGAGRVEVNSEFFLGLEEDIWAFFEPWGGERLKVLEGSVTLIQGKLYLIFYVKWVEGIWWTFVSLKGAFTLGVKDSSI